VLAHSMTSATHKEIFTPTSPRTFPLLTPPLNGVTFLRTSLATHSCPDEPRPPFLPTSYKL
jgi:hypothetical protein